MGQRDTNMPLTDAFPRLAGGHRSVWSIWVGCLMMWLLVAGAQGADAPKLKPSEPAVKKELTEVVEAQLAAFRANDFQTAYTFAASVIKEQFPLSAFEQMVRTGYPVIAQSATATFGVVLDGGAQAVVNTVIKGKSGKIVRYQYQLVHEGRGWKITGVTEQAGDGELA